MQGPSVVASVLVIPLVYVFRETLFKSTATFLTEGDMNYLSAKTTEKLAQVPSADPVNMHFYENWYEIPWKEMLAEARELEFFVSFMDSWIVQTSDSLQGVFDRGGTIRVFLPKAGGDAARRVAERFPEYTPRVIAAKISNTSARLQRLLEMSMNKNARLEIYGTNKVFMHCLMMIDKTWVILSPFDHFRHNQIEGPAFVVELKRYPRLAAWVSKEFEGFQSVSELS